MKPAYFKHCQYCAKVIDTRYTGITGFNGWFCNKACVKDYVRYTHTERPLVWG